MNTNETPLEDQRQQALKHYEEASNAIMHWSSFVRDAIMAYDPKQNSHKHGVMQAGAEKQPYFELSTNEFGKHWLFYKPLKSEPGKYRCWMPIDDEFYSEFRKLRKASLGSEATVASEGLGEANTCADCGREIPIGE